MRVLITGSTGLIGRAVAHRLSAADHQVVAAVRPGSRRDSSPAAGETIEWDPRAGHLDPAALVDIDAVVNLAGEPVAAKRWTDAQKRKILESRVKGTAAVAEAVAASERTTVLVSGSASGYYGDRGDEVLTEESRPGEGFLSELCQQWEAATETAKAAGKRVCFARTGIVLSKRGGALAKQLPLFKLGLGGPLAGGGFWMPWISRHDEARAIVHLLETDGLDGPFNLAGPTPATNAELTRALGHQLRRPAILPVPGFALKIVLGEMAGDILASARMVPERLTATGFRFDDTDVSAGLARAMDDPLP